MALTDGVRQLLEQARVPIEPREYLEREQLGDAEMLRDLMVDQIVFDHSQGLWYRWSGRYWEADQIKGMLELAAEALIPKYRHAGQEADRRGDRGLAQRFHRRSSDLGRVPHLRNVLTFASALRGISLRGDEWGVPPMQLPAANGIIDLATGGIRAGEPSDRIRMWAPTHFRGLDYPAVRWERLLHEIFGGDQAMMGFFRRLCGYAVTGDRSEQILPIIHGKGANGKSTVVDALSRVLGPDLASHTRPEAIRDGGRADGSAAQPFIASLRDKRLVWASESADGARLHAGLVKQLTGDESITVRDLYSKPVSFKQTHTMMLITNHRPSLPDGGDESIWRRVLLVPFEQSFVDEPRLPNEHKRQRGIAPQLREEAPGILAWLVRGALEWQSQGLNPPATVRRSTADYRAEEDMIGLYMQERLVSGEGREVAAAELYQDYKAWCEETGQKPVSASSLGQRVATRFGRSRQIWENGRNRRFHTGVGLLGSGRAP